MKKLPKIYQNEFDKKIHNNKSVFDSLKDSLEERTSQVEINNSSPYQINDDTLSVKDKIKELIKQNNYIFNTKVNLIFESHEETCQIAGIVNDHIITMENKIIKIDEIKDIKILK